MGEFERSTGSETQDHPVGDVVSALVWGAATVFLLVVIVLAVVG